MNNHFAVIGKVEGNITPVKEIIGKIFLDNMLLVAAADNKIIVAIGRVDFHNMPKDRHSADFDHRLRNKMTFFTYSGSESACKNYCFHKIAAFYTVSDYNKPL